MSQAKGLSHVPQAKGLSHVPQTGDRSLVSQISGYSDASQAIRATRVPQGPSSGDDPFNSDTESLDDFVVKPKKRHQPIHISANSDSDTPPPTTPSTLSPTPQTWDSINSDLQAIFPPDEKYTYIVEAYQSNVCETFPGAPTSAFYCQVRINLTNEEATEWLKKMQMHSCVTYRVTRTNKVNLRRVAYKTERHCQHYRKQLTTKQAAKAAKAKSVKSTKPLTGILRDKKTQCPSHLILTIQIPTKKQARLAEVKPYVLTHNGVRKFTFEHNHPITSAHALSFRDVSDETKQALYNLFEMGHSPSSARHAHQQTLYMQADTEADAQSRLADRCHNPLVQDICRLFTKWRETNYGKDDGEELFQKLQDKVDEFNAATNEAGGRAILQWYEAPESEDSEDSEPSPPKKRKKELRVIHL